ncbi:MAG: hypothetical protein V4858_29740 [Pseudomonadota bacterium]
MRTPLSLRRAIRAVALAVAILSSVFLQGRDSAPSTMEIGAASKVTENP